MTEMTAARREILEAAAECFMEQGFHATSIDVVARRMGATKGRVYHHYQSKVDLFFDVHRLGMDLLFEAVAPALKTAGDPLQVLAAICDPLHLAGNHTRSRCLCDFAFASGLRSRGPPRGLSQSASAL